MDGDQTALARRLKINATKDRCYKNASFGCQTSLEETVASARLSRSSRLLPQSGTLLTSAHRHWLDRLLRKGRRWIGPETCDAVQPKTHLPKGRAKSAIPTLARELKIDLIVMGTVARTGIPGLIIGNTAEQVLNAIDCSVLAVKPPGFVTPVALEA